MRRSEVVGNDWIIPQERYKTGLELVIHYPPQPETCLPRYPGSVRAVWCSQRTASVQLEGSLNSSGLSTLGYLPNYANRARRPNSHVGHYTIWGARTVAHVARWDTERPCRTLPWPRAARHPRDL